MQLAWLIRPEGQNIDRLMENLAADALAGMELVEAIRIYAPPGPDVTGKLLGTIFDALETKDADHTLLLSRAIPLIDAAFARRHPSRNAA